MVEHEVDSTGCLKIDATHIYESDLLLRQVQWWSFRTRPVKNAPLELESLDPCFFYCYYISFQDMQSLFEFLVSVINNYHINRLHLFGDRFEWFCLQISSDTKYFFLSCPRHCDQSLIVVIVYYFQNFNKKEHNIIIRRAIKSQIGPIYIETPYSTSRCGSDNFSRETVSHQEPLSLCLRYPNLCLSLSLSFSLSLSLSLSLSIYIYIYIYMHKYMSIFCVTTYLRHYLYIYIYIYFI